MTKGIDFTSLRSTEERPEFAAAEKARACIVLAHKYVNEGLRVPDGLPKIRRKLAHMRTMVEAILDAPACIVTEEDAKEAPIEPKAKETTLHGRKAVLLGDAAPEKRVYEGKTFFHAEDFLRLQESSAKPPAGYRSWEAYHKVMAMGKPPHKPFPLQDGTMVKWREDARQSLTDREYLIWRRRIARKLAYVRLRAQVHEIFRQAFHDAFEKTLNRKTGKESE